MAHHGRTYAVFRTQGHPPPNPAAFGHQKDGAKTTIAVAHTPQGDIPGKAMGNKCWYSYGGKEIETSTFSWLVCQPGGLSLVPNAGGPPPNAVQEGRQNDQPGVPFYCAVANSEWGTIPGKATGNKCWFPYGGKEHVTNSFSWVVCTPGFPAYH